jgi:predicted nucleic acid-binding protein
MIRIVLDTNVLISALLSSQGPPAQVLLMILLDSDTQLREASGPHGERLLQANALR